jgi:2-methylcitrate dehydratase PrpD
LLKQENLAAEDVQRVEVATYRIAAEHAETGWEDFASAQLSFPYLLALALQHRAIRFEHFDEQHRRSPALAPLTKKLQIVAPPEIDRLYPKLRPARVSVTTSRGTFTRQVDEALGSRLVPLDDAGLLAKFYDMVMPALGEARAQQLAQRFWDIEQVDDMAPLVESTAL